MKVDLIFWGLTALFLVLGIIMGAVRGSNRSILRLVLVLISVVAAFFLRNAVANVVLNLKVGGATVEDQLVSMLGENFPSMVKTAQVLVVALASVIVFIMSFLLLKFLSWAILYPLCKLFVKKGKKKHPIFGACIGLVQGAVIALCICVPLAGLVLQTEKLMTAVNDMQETTATVPSGGYYATTEDGSVLDIIEGDGEGEGEPEEPGEEEQPVNPDDENGENQGGEGTEGGNETGSSEEGNKGPSGVLAALGKIKMDSFADSFIGKFYGKTFKKPFTWISTVEVEFEDEDGKTVKKKYTLEDRVDTVVGAVNGAVSMVKDFAELADIEWDKEIDKDVAEQIQAVLVKLDETKNGINNEDSKEIINEIVNFAIKELDLPVQAEDYKFDMNSIKFADEGALIVDVVDVANKEDFSSEDLKTIATDLSKSTLVLPILESVDKPLDLGDRKEDVEAAFADPELSDPDKYDQGILDTLRFLFGLSDDNHEVLPEGPATDVEE